ncbi:glycohydrolase toxin TNT-related protein [Chitinophaga caseinilytica]|uniref:Glycohydrolase toxin TNT-related protein n=1 Tax=Chitinophaga caseinilytica TaxID=2267521 RepID=A0ABZ2YZG1_9BACT
MARLNGNDPRRRIGPSLVLKVQTGDTINLGARAFYKSAAIGKQQNTSVTAADMATALLSAFGKTTIPAPGTHGSGGGPQSPPFGNDFVSNSWQRLRDKEPQSPPNTNRPKAYLNFVLFDEQFKLVEGSSGVRQVAASPDQLQTLAVNNLVMKQSGFLYVYTSNEAPQDIFFDNIILVLAGTPVLEETHYYPFGLVMEGLSEKVLYNPVNKEQKFQGQPFDDDLGLNWYGFKFRNHDPQIGRFIQADPLSDKYVYNSTYAFSENHVTAHVELEGLEKISIQGLWQKAGISSNTDVKEFAKGVGKALKDSDNLSKASILLGQFSVLTIVGVATSGIGSGTLFSRGLQGMRNASFRIGRMPLTINSDVSGTAISTNTEIAIGIETSTAKTSSTTMALTNYWPRNGGALNEWSNEFLTPGAQIDRFGSGFGKYLSPRYTPIEMRALPPDNTGVYNAFKVVKPFEVQSSTIAPAFNQIGLGKQYLSPVNVNTLLKKGIIIPVQ